MAFSKANLYEEISQITAGFFKAFGHPARLEIMEKLSLEGPRTVNEICREHPISNPSLSDHFEILREAHLIVYIENYPYVIYSLHKENFEVAKKYIEDYFQKLSNGTA